jgi:hypothetical protein
VAYSRTVKAGLICDGSWECTEGTYNFLTTIAVKKTGDHYTVRTTTTSVEGVEDHPKVIEKEYIWTKEDPLPISIHARTSLSRVGPDPKDWWYGEWVEVGFGNGFDARSVAGDVSRKEAGSVTMGTVHLIPGLQFSHAYKVNTDNPTDITEQPNTMGLATAVLQNDSSWILPDYCPTP